jgi:hypothetical protein
MRKSSNFLNIISLTFLMLEVHPMDSIGAEIEESCRSTHAALEVLPKFVEFRLLAPESRN